MELDSIIIQDPLQDRLECFVSHDSCSVFVACSSDGTNKMTKGITLTFIHFKLANGKVKIENEAKLLWAANPKIRRFRYSYINDQIVFKDRKDSSCFYSYQLNSFDNVKDLIRKISKDFATSPCGDPDW